MRLIEQLRWWAAEYDRTNFGCQARKLLLEAAEALEKAETVKHGRCPYCEGENNDFIPLNQTVEYSGIEMSLNRQGMLRVRVYEPGKATFTTQDIVEIKRCPNCGAKMDGERVALEEVVDIDAQTQRNNAAMRRVIDFVMDGGAENAAT